MNLRSLRAWALVAGSLLTFAVARAACDGCDVARELMKDGKHTEALAVLKKAAKQDKKAAEPRGLLALCYSRLEKFEPAADSVEDFFERAPTAEQVAGLRETLKPLLGIDTPYLQVQVPAGVDAPFAVRVSTPVDPRPDFPMEGDLLLDAMIGVNGKADSIQVVKPGGLQPPMGAFEDSFAEALRRWVFFPATKDGVPVPVKMRAAMSIRVEH